MYVPLAVYSLLLCEVRFEGAIIMLTTPSGTCVHHNLPPHFC
jgi:hypothetical protein